MGKPSKNNKSAKIAAKEVIKKAVYPSMFGSHKSMVIKDLEDGTVVCKDDAGEYTTLKCRLDNGLADLNRHSGRWEGK